MIARSLSKTRTANPGATATSKAKVTKGHVAPLEADEDQSLETYCFSFLSLLYQKLTLATFFFPSSFSALTLNPRRRYKSSFAHLQTTPPSRYFRDTSSDSPSSPGLLSHEQPVKGMSPFQQKRTLEQPEDTSTPLGRGEEHPS